MKKNTEKSCVFAMKRVFLLCFSAIFILICGSVAMAAKTYIIVVDGLPARCVGMAYNGGNHDDSDITPNISSLKNLGTSYRMYDMLPSFTATNHVAIISSTKAGTSGMLGAGGGYTGLSASKEVTGDTYCSDNLDDRDVKTLYNAAGAAKKTAVISGKHWIAEIFGDEDCDLVVHPLRDDLPGYITDTEGYMLGGWPHLFPLPTDDINKPRLYIPPPRSYDPPDGNYLIPDINSNDLPSDEWVIDNAINIIDNYDPDLMYILLANVDESGHAYGALGDAEPNLHPMRNPDAMRDQIWISDAEVGRFITFLQDKEDGDGWRFDKSFVVLTADHGMSSIKDANHTVDIRMELKKAGYYMLAKDGHVNKDDPCDGYWRYEYCLTEGPTAYIFNPVDQNTLDTMADFLRTGLDVDGVNPVDSVYTGEVMNGRFGGPPCASGNFVWPDMIVLFKTHFAAYLYGDEIQVGMNAFHLEINAPEPIKTMLTDTMTVRSVPGQHGSRGERHVPCIITGPGIDVGVVKGPPPMGIGFGCDRGMGPAGGGGTTYYHNLAIAPTLRELNGWKKPGTFESGSFFHEWPYVTGNSQLITGGSEPDAFAAEFYWSEDLTGGGGIGTLFSYDDDPSDGFSAQWEPAMYPRGDYLVHMTQLSGGGSPLADSEIHLFSAPPPSGQVLLHENFDDGDISDWTVSVADGLFEPDTSYYKSMPYGLKMVSQGAGRAWGRTPQLEIDTTQDFTIATYFMVPNSDNHRFLVLDNNWVHLVIDDNTNLRAWQGETHGDMLHITTLNAGQWYWIRAEVHPLAGTYDIFVDGSHMDIANFLNDPPGNVFDYVRLGDIHDGSTDHGEGYWDGVFVMSELFADSDDDGFEDEADNCPDTANPAQEDRNSDGLGDACECLAAAGIDNDSGHVDLGDFALIALQWQETGGGRQSDINSDRVVDGSDLEILAYHWLSDCN